MPLSAALMSAYTNASYVVFGETRASSELLIRVGKPDPALDALLDAEGAPCAAYVTAANPRGERRGREENAAAHDLLQIFLREKRLRFRAGEGRDPQGFWTPEPSLLVFAIDRADAEALGRRLGQNALVFVEKGRAPELIVLT